MSSKQSVTIFLFLLSVSAGQDYIIEINQGRLSGSLGYDRRGGAFYSFLSIPYGKPPIGELRFKEPQPADSWDGILEATVEIPRCPQVNYTANPSGGEDCLYLSVHTPQLPADTYESLKEVMVFFHGGSFQSGSGNRGSYGPEYLLPEEVLLVTVNYRLGIFGSFNLENASHGYPGNINMKDMVLALQWIQTNIAKFGGNPDSVTIFGQSAGAAGVHYLVLSPMSSGLFHKAIMQSGVALCPWAYGFPNNGMLLAETLNISTDSMSEMLNELLNLSVDDVNEAQLYLYNQLRESQWPFLASPIAEQEIEGQTAFLTSDPLTVIRQGTFNQVPILIGYNDIDGLTFHFDYNETATLIPVDLNVQIDSEEGRELVERIERFYIDSGLFDEPIIQMHTDIWFGYPAYRTAREHAQSSNSSVYFYRFSADTQLNLKLTKPLIADYKGAAHSDERGYMFQSSNRPLETIESGSVEDIAVDRLVTLWTNFAKYGDPTPDSTVDLEWIAVNDNTFNYIDFGSTETIPGVDPDPENMRFWSEIYDEYLSD